MNEDFDLWIEIQIISFVLSAMVIAGGAGWLVKQAVVLVSAVQR